MADQCDHIQYEHAQYEHMLKEDVLETLRKQKPI